MRWRAALPSPVRPSGGRGGDVDDVLAVPGGTATVGCVEHEELIVRVR